MNGIIYCRVSTKEQIEGISLELQQERCREFAQNKMIQVSEVFIEEGESAKFADRPKLLTALDFCRRHRGRVQAFIVYKLDRLSRNTAEHYAVTSTLAKQGIRLFSVTEPIDNTPIGRFLEALFAANAQLDNDIKAERTKEYMRRRLHEGIWVWGPPEGYVSGKKPGARQKTEPDTPDPKTFPILQRAWKEFSTGLYSQTQIAKMLSQWGLAELTGRPVHIQYVRKLFTNKYYAGILTDPWTGEEIQGQHRPMVSQDEFAHVQILLSGKSLTAAPRIKHREEFPFRGFVRCGLCATPYTGSWPRGRSRRYPYYHCRQKTCAEYGKTVPPDKLHQEFGRLLKRVTPRPDFLETLQRVIQDLWQDRSGTLKKDRENLEKNLDKFKREKAALIEMKLKGLLSDVEFAEAKERIGQKIAEIQVTLGNAKQPDFNEETGIEFAFSAIEKFPFEWARMELASKQRFQQLVFPQGIPYFRNQGFGTPELGLIYEISRNNGSEKSSLVPLCFASWNRLIEELKVWATFSRAERLSRNAA